MSDTFKVAGSFGTTPGGGLSPSVDPTVESPINESLTIVRKTLQSLTLSSDSAATVSLGTLTGFNVCVLKARGGRIRVRLTSADGTTQAIPVDNLLCIISRKVPYTAIDLTREVGVETQVTLFLGEKAS